MAASLGMVVLLGWAAGWDVLTRISPHLASMKPLTATCFVLMGSAVALLPLAGRRPWRRICLAEGTTVAVIGGLTMGEYLSGRAIPGLDRALFPGRLGEAADAGRMSPATALAFLLLGTGVLAAVRGGPWARAVPVTATSAVLIGFVAFLGYVYGVSSLYQIRAYTSMALHTAAGVMVSGLALLLSVPDRFPVAMFLDHGGGGRLARRLAPAVFVVMPVIGWFRLTGERAGLYDRAFGVALMTMSLVTVFAVLTWSASRAIARSEAALIAANNALEQRVALRTAELDAAAAELARSNAELEQFAYLASHDLQEPLRHVSAFVQKLADRYSDVLDDRGRTYIGFAVDGTTRMQQLIEGLLEYSRVGRAQPALGTVDLRAVVDAAVRASSIALEAAGGRVACDGSLRPVLGDEDLLYRLLVNLISNAVKFRHPDRPPLIAVAAQDTGDGHSEITVADNGVGIDPRYRERVFEMFERLHGQEVPGTGIGLSVARRIVEAHGGTIRLEANTTGGTTVSFTLPNAAPNGQAPKR